MLCPITERSQYCGTRSTLRSAPFTGSHSWLHRTPGCPVAHAVRPMVVPSASRPTLQALNTRRSTFHTSVTAHNHSSIHAHNHSSIHAHIPTRKVLNISRLPPCAATLRHSTSCRASFNVQGFSLIRSHSGRPRPRVGCAASFKPVETLQKELDVQSSKLDDGVRERVEQAVQQLGYRVTVGDVAARAGVKLSEAEEALKALVYDALGNLEVSDDGQLLYVFSPDFQSTIRNKSLLLRAKPVVDTIKSGAMYLVRIGFGAALITSVLLVTLAIIVILSSAKDERDDRNRNNGGMNFRLWLDISDLFYFFDPYYYRTRRERMMSRQDMSFVESIFSFVFGDGDPNSEFDERRWKLLGRYIQSKGGVVVAEEIAPFLDPASGPETDSDATYVNESVVLPALIKFGGEAVVDDYGNIVYRFPSLQQTAQGRLAPAPAEKSVQEESWEMSGASSGQKIGAVALGALNVVGVGVLSSMLAEGANKAVLLANGLGFVTGLMPGLQLYAAAFFTIPAIRWFVNQARNATIDSRNLARLQWQRMLERPSSKLRQKLESAKKLAGNRVLKRSDSVYRTDKDVDDQLPKQDLADFDRKLGVGPDSRSQPVQQGGRYGYSKFREGGNKRNDVLWQDWVGDDKAQQKKNTNNW